jgi:heme-degrading monooxygenase HmoA
VTRDTAGRPAATQNWPEPPYHVTILKVTRTAEDAEGYASTLVRMLDLVGRQPGYLGRESATTADGDELTIVYYTDEDVIRAWHDHPAHLVAQDRASELAPGPRGAHRAGGTSGRISPVAPTS